jgi:hypothetical protein
MLLSWAYIYAWNKTEVARTWWWAGKNLSTAYFQGITTRNTQNYYATFLGKCCQGQIDVPWENIHPVPHCLPQIPDGLAAICRERPGTDGLNHGTAFVFVKKKWAKLRKAFLIKSITCSSFAICIRYLLSVNCNLLHDLSGMIKFLMKLWGKAVLSYSRFYSSLGFPDVTSEYLTIE